MAEGVNFSILASLVSLQEEAEQVLLQKIHMDRPTFEQPLVKVNPYLINPLSALICFMTETEVSVTIRVHGREASQDVTHVFDSACQHILPVLGLYPNAQNIVDVVLSDGRERTIRIATDPLGEDAPRVISARVEQGILDGGTLLFVTPSLNALPTAIDGAGDIRWHLNTPLIFAMKPLRNGNVLIGTERVLQMPYYVSGLYEMTLAGKVVREYSIPGGYHHDQWEQGDGNLLVLTDDPDYGTLEDQVVLIDRNTGNVLRRWDLKGALNPGDGAGGSYTERDWFHNNALWYDEPRGEIVLSGRHTDSIASIDYETGALKWILGDPTNWSDEAKPYLYEGPADAEEFDWFYAQHSCVVLDNGDVMCFDNGKRRSKDPSRYIKNRDNFSRGVRYRLDRTEKRVQQVWQYGKELGEDFYSSYIGNVEYLGENHYLVHSGGIQYYGEHASEKPAALIQDDPMVRTESETVEIENNEILMEVRLTGNFYRAKKLDLYHAGNNAPLGAAKRMGSIGKTSEFGTFVPAERTGELLPECYGGSIVEEEDRFTFSAVFESGQLVMIVLEGRENKEDRHAYFVSTSKNKFAALCSGVFLSKDPRSVALSISREGLHGTYDVCIVVDDVEYETGFVFDCLERGSVGE